MSEPAVPPSNGEGDNHAELRQLRDGIDAIDHQVLDLINRRAQLAHRIGEIKHGNIYRPEREAQVLRRLAYENPGPLPAEAVQTIFREVMSACLALEQPLSVAYLGPAGTFSESAARKHFGSAPTLKPVATIDDAFREVQSGHMEYCVVPVENSTEGAIGRTLDLLLETPLMVCGEILVRVHQNLMTRSGSMDGVKRIYSHAQSLAQCHEWLNRNAGGLERVAVVSNAEAARRASMEPDAAAVAGEAAAALYGLNVVAPNIEDDPQNTTRFLVLGVHDAGPSGDDKTSLVCSLQNRPGALHYLIEPLAQAGVSMTKFESRPAGAGLWEYVFYVDVEGHAADARVGAALDGLRNRAGFLKILGSYPRAR
jgi:chorismate mutase/prephenate dehydratase